MNNRIHVLQHVYFEGPAAIANWAIEYGFKISYTHIYKSEKLPDINDFDILIIMGGPMGVYDSGTFGWLLDETEFIRESIGKGKPTLGICLGAQLIAHALGGRVYKGAQKEIGWYPLTFNSSNSPLQLADKLTVFHWHGDTFDLPKGSKLFASSVAIKNQAFIYNNNVIALQFHLEMTQKSLQLMIENAGHELMETGSFLMPEKDIITEAEKYLNATNQLLYSILDYLSDRTQ